MERILVREATPAYFTSRTKFVGPTSNVARNWIDSTPDGDLMDLDVFEHRSSIILEAFGAGGTRGFCPIQQPLMMENLIFRPGLNEAQVSQVITRLAEHAIEEAYRRDAGEVYFLCRDESTKAFAVRHGFKNVADLGLTTYRLNLLESYGK